MTIVSQLIIRNRLLSSLEPHDFARLAPHLEAVELPRAHHSFQQRSNLCRYRENSAAFMQVSGRGYRIQSIQLSHAIEESFNLRSLLLRFAQVMSVQTSYTALSNATDNIEQRLARWLLMCDDRSNGETIDLTHAFLSVMLAVRRQSITTSLHVLEGKHLISSGRNRIRVRDRKGLEGFASGTYGPAEDEYRKLIGSFGN